VKVLVTGANGFIGRHVVGALTAAGHRVHALIRPNAIARVGDWGDGVEVVRCNLDDEADQGELQRSLECVDAVIHLAASMRGLEDDRLRETVLASERFFAALARSRVKRLLLASSLSVYDWLEASGEVDEDLPLAREGDGQGGYANAKLAQERMARSGAEQYGWRLTVLRPGFVWGDANPLPAGSLGRRLGRLCLVFVPSRQLPFTHVENCADCFRSALEDDRSIGATFNVVDGFDLTAWDFAGEAMSRGAAVGIRLGVPYWLLRSVLGAMSTAARGVMGHLARLPSLLVPSEFAQNYRPVHYRTDRLREALGWRPPLELEECLIRTFNVPVATATLPE